MTEDYDPWADRHDEDGRLLVHCDRGCVAYEEPFTCEEYLAALEHWRDHEYLHGCSHGG